VRFIRGVVIASWKLIPIPWTDDVKYRRHVQFMQASMEADKIPHSLDSLLKWFAISCPIDCNWMTLGLKYCSNWGSLKSPSFLLLFFIGTWQSFLRLRLDCSGMEGAWGYTSSSSSQWEPDMRNTFITPWSSNIEPSILYLSPYPSIPNNPTVQLRTTFNVLIDYASSRLWELP